MTCRRRGAGRTEAGSRAAPRHGRQARQRCSPLALSPSPAGSLSYTRKVAGTHSGSQCPGTWLMQPTAEAAGQGSRGREGWGHVTMTGPRGCWERHPGGRRVPTPQDGRAGVRAVGSPRPPRTCAEACRHRPLLQSHKRGGGGEERQAGAHGAAGCKWVVSLHAEAPRSRRERWSAGRNNQTQSGKGARRWRAGVVSLRLVERKPSGFRGARATTSPTRCPAMHLLSVPWQHAGTPVASRASTARTARVPCPILTCGS